MRIDSNGEASNSQDGQQDRQVLEERVRMVFERTRVSGLVKLVFGVLVCVALAGSTPNWQLWTWSVLLLLATAWRCLTDWRHHRGRTEPAACLRAFRYALAADGFVLGAVSWWLPAFPDEVMAVLMQAAVVGAAAVALIVLSADWRTHLAYNLPLLLPGLVWQLFRGGPYGQYIGAALMIFIVLVLLEGHRAYQHIDKMLRLRFSMDELAAQRQAALDLAERRAAVKRQFLATMSHEMRTPLHGMLGITRLLQNEDSSGDELSRKELLDMQLQTGEHLLSLINDVLDFSKIEGGHVQLFQAPLDLALLVSQTCDMSRIVAHEKGLTFDVTMAARAPCWVRGDAARLRQILLNLLGNALKFTEVGGIRVEVLRQTDGATTIAVYDTGAGITANELLSVFDAFHQGDTSDGSRPAGTGLGLSISRELAKAMGGDITCVSEPGSGSGFTLTVNLPESVPLQPLAPTPAITLGGHVLLVEDDRLNALVAESLLRRSGLTVDCVEDGAQAIEYARARRYDLILMDCQMPNLDGFEASRRIRADEIAMVRSPVPIVAVSAHSLEEGRQRSLDAGMDDHLAKPFRDASLRQLLSKYCRRPEEIA